jgi:hypothetical protein
MLMRREQQVRVCQALCKAAGQTETLFTVKHGPGSRFFQLVEGEECSAGEWILLSLAQAIWTSRRNAGPHAGLMLAVLDDKNLTLVGELLQALGAQGEQRIEAWLAAAGFPRLESVP